jgi:hypothetical protein
VKCGARVAMGVAGGYFLGRTKKMKLALMLGGMAAGRRAGGPAQLLAQGTKLLGQSPELARLTDEISGRLLDAGKGAAVAVATRQVEALTERVVNRVGTLTEAGGKTVSDVSDTAGGTVGAVGKTVGGLGGRQSRDDVEYDDEYDEESAEGPGEESAEDRSADTANLDESRDAPDDGAGRTEADANDTPSPPRRRAAPAGSGGKGAADATVRRAGGTTRLAGKATTGRAGRSAGGRQGRSDG